jgi:hypothetical protein
VHFDDEEHTWVIGARKESFDVESMALHEIGHILGLDHSDVPGAVMLPVQSPNTTVRALTGDDIAGFRRLYRADAAFVSQSVPTQMEAGRSYAVALTMRNVGTTNWTAGGDYPFRLGSQAPQDNRMWGVHRVDVPAMAAVGAEATFRFSVTAPAAAGTYDFQWRMVQEQVEWFGGFTDFISVTVADPAGNVRVPDVREEPLHPLCHSTSRPACSVREGLFIMPDVQGHFTLRIIYTYTHRALVRDHGVLGPQGCVE